MSRSSPEVRAAQAKRRRQRKVAAGVCAWGGACGAALTEEEVLEGHRVCARHRARRRMPVEAVLVAVAARLTVALGRLVTAEELRRLVEAVDEG